MIEEILFKLGIPTYMESVYTTLTAKAVIRLPKQMPTQIGWIYGLSVYCDGVTPTGETLITTAQSEDLYMVLKAGQTDFIESYRVSQLNISAQNGNDIQYCPVNIPAAISLDQSFWQNPLLITGAEIMLNIYYIDQKSFDVLVAGGWMGINGRLNSQ